MLRSTLIQLLKNRRENDVVIAVPLETGGTVRKDIARVYYDPDSPPRGDRIVIETEMYFDGPDQPSTDSPAGSPDGPGRAGERTPPPAPAPVPPAIPPAGGTTTDPIVWISTGRHGIDYHAGESESVGLVRTRCGRPVAGQGYLHGVLLNRSIALAQFASKPCPRCYPDGDPT